MQKHNHLGILTYLHWVFNVIQLDEVTVNKLNNTHIISLDGEDASIRLDDGYALVKSVSGKERKYSLNYAISALKGKKGFNFNISGSISNLDTKESKLLPMVIPNKGDRMSTTKVEKISVHKMLDLIQFESITYEGRPAKLAVHCRGNTQIPKIIDKKNKESYFSDWGTVIHVVENKGGSFIKEDMLPVSEAVSKGTHIHPKKTEITTEEINALCMAEVTLEGEPAVITFINSQDGCISTISNGYSINRPWEHIQFTVIQRNGEFFINQAAHERKRSSDSNDSNYGVSLYSDFSSLVSSHKETKEKLAKIISTCLEKKKNAVPELQMIYLELNKLDLLMDLAKSKHAYAASSSGPWGYRGEYYGD